MVVHGREMIAEDPAMEATALVTTSAAAIGAPAASAADIPVEDLTEYRGRSLPGALAVLTGVLAATAALGTLWWTGVLPDRVAGYALLPARPAPAGDRLTAGLWGTVILLAALAVVCFGGLTRGRPGTAWLLTHCGGYRGTVRRTGLLWINPLLGRRRMDVTLRHWRSRPLDAVDAGGARLEATVLVVWRIRDTARAGFVVEDHVRYLRDQVESGVALVLSRLPADDFDGGGRTLRDTDHVGAALTRALDQEMRPVGIEVIRASPVRIEYAPAIAEAMRRRQQAALGAGRRRPAFEDVVDTVSATVRRLGERGLVALDDRQRESLVNDLAVALCTARGARRG
jgi:SPFH domain / Band 7 family